jgi:hypothetical protein
MTDFISQIQSQPTEKKNNSPTSKQPKTSKDKNETELHTFTRESKRKQDGKKNNSLWGNKKEPLMLSRYFKNIKNILTDDFMLTCFTIARQINLSNQLII